MVKIKVFNAKQEIVEIPGNFFFFSNQNEEIFFVFFLQYFYFQLISLK